MFMGAPWPRIGLFGLSGAFAIGYGFFGAGADAAIQLVKEAGYWLMLATVAALGLQLLLLGRREHWRFPPPRAWPAAPCLFVGAVSALLWILQPSGFKIVMDEPVLAATSLQMHQSREVMTAARGYEINGVFHLLGGFVDKRPYFFPFLTSLLHDFTGYRAHQGVVLNFALTPLTLGLLFAAGSRFWPRWGGYSSVGLFATAPLLAMNVNSAGFGILNVFMILCAGWAAAAYLRAPDDLRMNVVILTVVLLAQTRYESAMFVLPAAWIIAVGWRRRGALRLSWTAVAAPLLLLPIALQRAIRMEYPGFWQLDKGVEAPFGLSFVPENLEHAADFFFALNARQPNSLLLSVAFLAALLVAAGLVSRAGVRAPRRPETLAACGFGAAILANMALLMAYHWGQLDDITATRIALPFLLLQVLTVTAVFGRLPPRFRAGPCLGMATALFFVGVTRPVCARTDFIQWGTDQHEVELLDEWVRQYSDGNPLFITDKHLVPLNRKVSALPVDDAVEGKARLALHRRLRTFDAMYVAYPVVGGEDAKPTERARRIESAFELETVRRRRLALRHDYRLARVTGIDVPEEDALELGREALESARDPAARMKLVAETLP